MTTIMESIVEETALACLLAMSWQVEQGRPDIASVTLVALPEALLAGPVSGDVRERKASVRG